MTIDKNIEKQNELSGNPITIVDDSNAVKENKQPIEENTPEYSPTKNILDTAKEIVDEAEYNPPEEKIAAKAKAKLAKQVPEGLDDILNYQPKQKPTKTIQEQAAEARIERAQVYDIDGPTSSEYKKAREKENALLSQANMQPISLEDAQKMLDDYQARVDEYTAVDQVKDDYFMHLKQQYTNTLNKIIQDDTKSWIEKKKLIGTAGLLLGNILQNVGATMHNIANPNDWKYASDPITLRRGQNLATSIKNRQTNNDKYIDNQIEYWKGVIPEYIDASKIKQRLGNSRVLNEYKRLDESSKKMIAALASSDAWETTSQNAILSYMDNLQAGAYSSPAQMAAGLVTALMTSSDKTSNMIIEKLKDFFTMMGINPDDVKKLVRGVTKTAGTVVGAAGSAVDGISNITDNIKGITKRGNK